MTTSWPHRLCELKSWDRCVTTGEIVGVSSPTSVIEGGGAQHIRRGSPHLSG
jgi:hypothetical protein